MTKNLTTGTPWRVVLAYTLPIIAGNLFQQLYSMVDTLIVGRTIGADALAAVGSTTTIVYFVLCFIQGLTTGFSVLTGQHFGAGDERGIRRSVGSSVLLCSILSIVLTALTVLFCKPILRAMKTPEDIFAYSYDYIVIIFAGTAATVFYNMISNIIRSLGDSRTPLIFLVISSVLNVFLDILFIVPLNMGVAGAAWATVISQLLSAVLCLVCALKRFPILKLSRSELSFDRRNAYVHLKIGLPMGFQMSVMCIGQLAMQLAVNTLGTTAIAGFTAGSKLDQFAIQINNAYCTSSAGYVAQNFGAGDLRRIREGCRAALIQAAVISLSTGLLMLAARPVLIPLFLDKFQPEIYSYASRLLFSVMPFYPVLSVLSVYRSALQSMNHPVYPFTACVIELVMRLTASLLLSRFWGYTVICLSSPLAWIGAAVFLTYGYVHVLRLSRRGRKL